jgi:hypothetical protein
MVRNGTANLPSPPKPTNTAPNKISGIQQHVAMTTNEMHVKNTRNEFLEEINETVRLINNNLVF